MVEARANVSAATYAIGRVAAAGAGRSPVALHPARARLAGQGATDDIQRRISERHTPALEGHGDRAQPEEAMRQAMSQESDASTAGCAWREVQCYLPC